ncbi:aminotransferase-like domain-containing protein [Antrihabitans cavernicola]|uniref:PLP-dependent aminotransferase family protein n=1 Tax=Antrihabitans cavernicola TaxID=2495913 RepID=A0A5A7S9T8_9NOCA|nr:PLP-dependent aminotransferase family protein [Spelaeibacter cavernicola]KAA0022666.1 PLP-dependent aminotransferase family protein [Spelaeibacter cavernicola]
MHAPPLARRLNGLQSSAIRDLLTITARADIISLAGGLPDPDLIPRDRIRAAADAALVDPSSVQYTETSGWAGLRDVLAVRESKRLGRAIAASEIVVTHGSQQALSLLAQVLLDPGALVIVEDPAYTGALQVFRTAEAQIEAVPLDDDGMSVDALSALLESGVRPTVVHTVSNFHNPGSVSLSTQRRVRLAELADRYGFWVIEDDPYGEIWFHNAPPLPVAAHSDRVIRLSSASKILAPALRTGWLQAPEHVCRAVELIKQGVDLCGSALTQRIAATLLADDDWLESHLGDVRSAYRERSETLSRAVQKEFGDAVASTDVDGGMFCWLDFRDGTDTETLLAAALDEGVAFVPGSAFAVGNDYKNAMRLCFTTSEGSVLEEAVARLACAHGARLRS